MRLVDTNIPIYAVSNEPPDADKRAQARELLLNHDGLALSAQVLGEFYYQATRSTKANRLTHQDGMRRGLFRRHEPPVGL